MAGIQMVIERYFILLTGFIIVFVGKQTFEIDGKEVKCQVGINITVLGSKKKATEDDE